jgi:type I restriction enzyme R subunit
MFLDPDREVRKHRDRLPHWHQDDTAVFLTWRLADSLPKSVVVKFMELRDEWLDRNPKPWTTAQAAEYNRQFILPLEDKLDTHHGQCVLRAPGISGIVSEALHFFDGQRYGLDAYVVMPNHVHVLIILEDAHPLDEVIQSIKSYTAKEINRVLGRSGKLWQRGYWDRLIRSEKHLLWTRNYIANNPTRLPSNHYRLWSAQ